MRSYSNSLVKGRAAFLLALVALAGRPAPAVAQSQTAMYGGIEIGAKGVKATVIRVTLNKEGQATGIGKPILRKTANTTLAATKNGKLRKDAIEETAEEVRKFCAKMQKDFRVPAKNIYVIASSGVPDAANRSELIEAVSKASGGKKLMFIGQTDEVRLSIMGLLKTEYLDNTVFVDVGSGSTKCGYIEPESSSTVMRLSCVRTKIEGTVSFTRRVKAATGPTQALAGRAAALRDTRVTEPLREELERRPGLVNRNRVFLSGGIVWALATLTRPEACKESLVQLTVADMDRLVQRLAKAPTVFPAPDLSAITDPALRAQAAKDLKRVRDTFTTDNLIAGVEILRGIAEALRLNQGQKKIYFARDGYIAWIYAYVKENAVRP